MPEISGLGRLEHSSQALFSGRTRYHGHGKSQSGRTIVAALDVALGATLLDEADRFQLRWLA